MAADYISSCLEEIALEGLDGITIEALWVRLEDRQPPFPLKLDDNSKSYLWRLISVQKDLAFYELPNARGGLILADRFKHTDPSTGIFLELENYPEDIYPLEIISDKNILGSCTTYRTRLDITHLIRTEDDQCIRTHQEVLRRWDRKLVIVASQEARTASLYGPEVDPSLVLPEKHYCILERIGRSRRQGEITHGKHSLLIFKEPSKTIFYLRKGLIRHGLIKVQPFNQKLANGINGAGKCLHLKRFFVEYKPIYLGLLENLTQRLSQKPKQSEALTVIRSEMKMRDASFKKLYQFGQKYVKTEMIRHKDFYPDSTKEEYMIKVGTKERFVRVLTLKKLYKYSSEAKSDDEEGSDGEDGGAAGRKDRTWNRVVELPLLHQAYQFARSKGEIGASQSDFREAFCVSKLDARLMARNLDRLGMVKTILQDQGKQRVQMFVAKEHLAGSSLHKKLQEEKDKIVKLTLPRFDARDSPFSTPTGTPLSSRATSPAPGTSGLARGDSHLDLSSLDDSVPLIDTDNDSEKYHFKKKGAHVTYRLLKRANQILKAVQEARLVDNIYYIQKKIIEDETAEGYTCRCDKKSLLRLIERLAREGQIKSIKTLIKYGNEEKQLHFLCDPSISASDEIVTSAIEAAKLRHIAVSKEYSKEIRKGDKASEPNLEHSDLNIPNYGLLTSHLTMRDMKYDSDAGRRYGYKPRMQRLQLIHQLLFYLVHDYDLERAKELAETAQAVPPIYGATPDCLADANLDLKVYCEDMTWKRFMPPLPKHREYEDGWCLIGDVLLRLPVSVFCQIIRVNFKITGLEDLLNHPVYTNLTVGKLPSHMRQQLMIERKYIFSFYSNCISLCLMGLISFGKREWKQKEQIFVHVNRRATLVDTTETDEPLDSRPEEYFEFSDMADLDNYWFRLQWICLNTPLDAIVINADPVGTNHSHAVKIERFTAFLDGHLPIEISDDGTLPGNRLGAAGLDSTFFGHLRRNWSSSSGHLKSETLISEGKRRLVEEGRNVVKKPRSIKRSYSDSEHEDPSTNVPDNFPESATAGSILEAMSQGGLEIPDEDDADTSPSTIPVTWAVQPKPSTSSAKRPEIMTKKVIVEGGKAPLGGKGVKRKAAGSAKHGEQSPKTKDTTLPGSLIKQEAETTDTAQKGTKVPIEPVAKTRGGELVLDKTSHVSTVPERVKRTSPVMIDLTASDPLQEVSQSTAETVPPGVIEIAPISDTGEGTPAKKRKVDGKDVKEGEKTPESGVKTPKARGKGPPPKRKNEIDSIDRDALKKMTKERVMWTTQEDSLLLLCEVASQILGGIRRDFLVQFTIVRDLMHKNFTTSQDKTSKACQRRIRYIMKNSETMANVNMYKGEALQDKAIVDDFLVGKKYSRTTKKKAMLNEVFVQLVERLRDKFKSSAERAPLKLPDTLEEVYRRYTLSRPTTASKSKHQTATSEKDIHFSVLHNVIHSAMVIQDKTGHANELYHVFSQYPDNLLQAVFNQMRADGIVTKIKAYAAHKDPGGKRTMPGPSVAIGNYQMAQRYTYKWFSRYRKAIFIQAYLLLEKFCSDGEKTKAITRAKNNTEGQAKAPKKDLQKIDGKVKESVERTADQEEKADRPAGEEGVTEKVETSSQQEEDKENAFPTNMMPMKDEGVHVAITVSLMIQRKCVMHTCIPDQVIVVESQYMSNQKQKKRKKKLTDIEKELHLGTASDEEEEALIEEAEKARAAQEAAASTLDADWENKKTTSRTSLVLFRSQYANGPISVRMLAPQDHIVINSCAVSLELDPTFNRNNYPKPVHPFADTSYDNRQYHHHWNNAHMWIHPKTCLRLLSSVRKLEPTEIDLNAFYHACWNKWKFSARKMTKIRDIFEDVNEKGPIGMTRDVMMEKYGHIRGLHRMLGAFSEHHVVRRVGVTQVRYVSYKHLSPWLVHSYKNLKGRSADGREKMSKTSPFEFDPVGEADDVSGDEVEEVQFDVPAAPQGAGRGAQNRGTPPANKYKILSFVRSAILEEREPGTEDTSNPETSEKDDDNGTISVEQEPLEAPMCVQEKEDTSSSPETNEKDNGTGGVGQEPLETPMCVEEGTSKPERREKDKSSSTIEQENPDTPLFVKGSSSPAEGGPQKRGAQVAKEIESVEEPAGRLEEPGFKMSTNAVRFAAGLEVFKPRVRVRLPRPAVPGRPFAPPAGPRIRLPVTQPVLYPGPPPPRALSSEGSSPLTPDEEMKTVPVSENQTDPNEATSDKTSAETIIPTSQNESSDIKKRSIRSETLARVKNTTIKPTQSPEGEHQSTLSQKANPRRSVRTRPVAISVSKTESGVKFVQKPPVLSPAIEMEHEVAPETNIDLSKDRPPTAQSEVAPLASDGALSEDERKSKTYKAQVSVESTDPSDSVEPTQLSESKKQPTTRRTARAKPVAISVSKTETGIKFVQKSPTLLPGAMESTEVQDTEADLSKDRTNVVQLKVLPPASEGSPSQSTSETEQKSKSSKDQALVGSTDSAVECAKGSAGMDQPTVPPKSKQQRSVKARPVAISVSKTETGLKFIQKPPVLSPGIDVTKDVVPCSNPDPGVIQSKPLIRQAEVISSTSDKVAPTKQTTVASNASAKIDEHTSSPHNQPAVVESKPPRSGKTGSISVSEAILERTPSENAAKGKGNDTAALLHLARQRRNSESMAPSKAVSPSLRAVPKSAGTARLRTVSLSETKSGTSTKLTRIPSVLSPRALPTLESFNSRRARTMSESSEGKQAEPPGTMVQLLEGITEVLQSQQAASGAKLAARREESMNVSEDPPDHSGDHVVASKSQTEMSHRPFARRSDPKCSASASIAVSVGQFTASISPTASTSQQPLMSPSRSPFTSPIMSPKRFSSPPPSERSPRALTNTMIVEMLQSPDMKTKDSTRAQGASSLYSSPSRAVPPHGGSPAFQSSPKAVQSPTLLAAIQSPLRYAGVSTNPLMSGMTSPVRVAPHLGSPLQQRSAYSSIKQALLSPSPAIQRLTFSGPLPPGVITSVLPPPGVGLPVHAQSAQQTTGTRPPPKKRAKKGDGTLAQRRKAKVTVSTGPAVSQGVTSPPAVPPGVQITNQGAAVHPGKGGGMAIELPVKNLPGYDSVKHLLHKGANDTVRVQLPAGYRMPTANAPVRFSVISEDQARQMGLIPPGRPQGIPGIVRMPAVRPSTTIVRAPTPVISGVRAPVPAPAPPPAPAPAPPSALAPSASASREPEVLIETAGTEGGDQSIPQVDGTADDKPCTTDGHQSTENQPSSSSEGTPLNDENPSTSTEGQITGDAKPSTSTEDQTVEVGQRPTSSDSKGRGTKDRRPTRNPKTGKINSYPKFKGRTPESSFHKLYQRVHLVPRPWRQTDGLVNKPTLKLMLESVLILIMSRPGITQEDVTAQYNPILQPVPVLELVEMLMDIGCVRTVHLTSSHSSSLFSSRIQMSVDERPDSLKAYVPTVDCVLKLGQFEAQLTTAMSPKTKAAMATETLGPTDEPDAAL